MNEPLLIAGVGGYVTGIVRRSGQVVWQHDLHDTRANHIREDTTVIPAVEPPFAAALSVSSKTGSNHVYEWYVRLLCCDYATGRILWSHVLETGTPFSLKPSLQIQEGLVLVGGANVLAFEATSGQHLWSTNIVPEARAAAGTGFVGALSNMLTAQNPKPWNSQIARRRD